MYNRIALAFEREGEALEGLEELKQGNGLICGQSQIPSMTKVPSTTTDDKSLDSDKKCDSNCLDVGNT